MTKSAKISFGFIALVLALVAAFHISTLFLTLLFSFFALKTLQFGQGRWIAIVLFFLLVTALGYGFFRFFKQAYVEVPKIVMTTVPVVIDYAEKRGFELPFSDYESLKALARETVTEKIAGVGKYAKGAMAELVAFLIGLVAAISLFINARFQLEPDPPGAGANLYTAVCAQIAERFRTFYASFSTVMSAQIIISAVNTALTAVFLLWNHFPFVSVIVGLTFLFGLVPILGNLCSNVLIVSVGLTISPSVAFYALLFLVVLHKLEYFLNSNIIGHRIKNPMWLTLIGLVVGERLMGVPGLILAPAVLHYVKTEASRSASPDTNASAPLPAPRNCLEDIAGGVAASAAPR